MGMPAIDRRWTTADVRALMDESRPWPRYELIDGELLVTPAPARGHQLAVIELVLIIAAYLEQEPVGIVFTSPADLELRPGTITQPDVFVVPAGMSADASDPGWGSVQSLLLATEVISPGNTRADRVTKREHYMKAGVPVYLIIDVDSRMIERWIPGQDTPAVLREHLLWHPEGAKRPLVVSLPQFFDRIAAKLRLLGRPS
jgi:Uma2 family endonuclease